MSILSQLKGNGSKSKWTPEEEVTFITMQTSGASRDAIFKATGRSVAGYPAKKKQLLTYLTEQGCETIEDCVAAIYEKHGQPVPQAEEEVEAS